MSRKFIVSSSILIFSILAIFLLWKHAVFLSALLLLLAYIKHRLFPIKLEWAWFALICVGGAFVEVLLVNISNAWSYASTQLFNIPIWMPLFWGVVGTTVIVMYEGLVEKRSKPQV